MPRHTLTGYLTVLGALATAVFTLPGAAALWWGLIGAVSVGAIGWGIHRHRPPRRAPWLLFAGGVAALAGGDVCYELSLRLPAGDILAICADVCYLATFGLLAAGVLSLTRTSLALRDRSGLLDMLTLVLVTGLITWILVMKPAIADTDLPAVEKALLAVHSLGGVLVVVVMLRLAAAAWRSPAVLLLTTGAAAMLVADVCYAIAELGAGWQPGGPVELGWFVFYLTWGAAALHRSMAPLTAVAWPSRDEVAAMRVSLVTLTCLSVPVLLLIQAFTGAAADLADGLFAAAAAGLTTLLAVTRVIDSVDKHRSAVNRERSLRTAGTELLGATTVDDVAATVRRSVTDLMPAGAEATLLFVIQRSALESGAEQIDSAVMAGWQPQLVMDDPLPVDAGRLRSRILPTRLLHPVLAARLAPAPTTVVASLAAPVQSAGSGTALLVAAADGVLTASRDAIEVIAGLAASALHRMAATEESARRDRDRYLNLIAGTVGEAVMIIDSDGRIRYASPPCGQLLGIELPVLAHWRELIHPEDHGQVARTLAEAGERGAGRGIGYPAGSAEAGGDGAEHYAGRAAGDQWVLRRPDGSHTLLEVWCRDLRKVRGVRGLVLTLRDVAEQRRRESELARRQLDRTAPGQNRRSLQHRFR
ncbi:hypothetical protein ACN27F_13640 [Solwaraspora sp. WMMB335]|uniref:hypothetical protein n=1 Tax=Solwaraspora sp. WMMB335 TaxID=3404118 RepID=UPI003B94137E